MTDEAAELSESDEESARRDRFPISPDIDYSNTDAFTREEITVIADSFDGPTIVIGGKPFKPQVPPRD